MAEDSKIQWTRHSFNPWRGCTKVSAGCANCYAETLSGRNPKTLGVWGPKGTRVVAAEKQWREPLGWDKKAKAAGERHRVFCASLADVFEDWTGPMVDSTGMKLLVTLDGKFTTDADDNYPRPASMQDVRRRLFDLIDRTPNLDWLLVTKRPENILRMMPKKFEFDPEASSELAAAVETEVVRPNVWIGTSVEDQQTADFRIPHLLKVPARVRFLSCEPLLGPVDLGPWMGPWTCDGEAGVGKHDGKSGPGSYCGSICRDYGSPRGPVDWVIVGGESGPNARPMHPAWATSLRDQCRAAGVPFFFKQWGEFSPIQLRPVRFTPVPSGVPMDEPAAMFDVGKKVAGRLLDGREWNEFPEVSSC